MSAVIVPTDEAELVDAVGEAVAAKTPLSIAGNSTRVGFGRPVQTAKTLSTSGLTGITLLEPAEMIFSARAGTPVSEVEAALASHGQMLTFEPMDHRPLYGTEGEPTIGAVVAGNISGPRRLMAGAARDSLIGVRFVNGAGTLIKNGGRVMKNVTGLDLVKLMAGSWGTLGVLSEVTFKVLPKPEMQCSLQLSGLSDADGVKALCQAMTTPFEPTGAAHMPAGLSGSDARTLIRLEGFEDQLAYRFGRLAEALAPFGTAQRVDGEMHGMLWQGIRDVQPLTKQQGMMVLKVSTTPTKSAALMAAIAELGPCQHYYDWSGGLIWVGFEAAAVDLALRLRALVSQTGGHATLMRADAELRQQVDPVHDQGAAVTKLSAGIKQSLDPHALFNPAFMQAAF